MTTDKDNVILAIEQAERAVLRSLGKDIPLQFLSSTSTADVERALTNTLRALGKR